jgi:acetoacetyl-CoA reductase/3-oxoacyl-[acyl-carrier protein] reductase
MNVSSLLDLKGRVAVVTGGAGAIGAAICTRLIESGATVFCLDRPGQTSPAGTVTLACDVTDASAVAAALAELDRAAGRLDIVVHAAGITRDARLWKASADDWNLVIATNLSSAFHLLHAAVPLMRKTGAGAVVLISSINGERGKVGQSSYAASKAGVNALARTAAREVGAFGIRVNAIAPGWIETPMTATAPEEARQRALAESPLGRLGEPDDVARATMFLVSDLARHITGQVLRVDGGQLIG